MFKFWEKLIRRASVRAMKKLVHDENYLFARGTHLFKDISAGAFLLVMKSLVERHYKLNEVIFRENHPGICMFLVKAGRVEIYSRAKSDEAAETAAISSTLGEGALFGELSILSMAYRTFSARALTHDTVLLAMSTHDLEQLLDRFPRDGLKVLRGITDTIMAYLIETDLRLRQVERQIEQLKERIAKYE